jgi:hypothetical protein
MLNDSSRYRLSVVYQTEDDHLYFSLNEREPYGAEEDDIIHITSEGETLFSIAHKYYGELPGGVHHWWLIGEYQPTPIKDPSLRLAANSLVIIPSVRKLLDVLSGNTLSEAIAEGAS